MKKMTGKILAGALALGCVCAAASCSFTGWTMNDVKDSLKDNDYVVTIEKDADFYGYEGLVEKALYAEEETVSVDDIVDGVLDGDYDVTTRDYFYMYEFKNARTAKLYYNMEKAYLEDKIEELQSEIALYEFVVKEYKRDMGDVAVEYLKETIKQMKESIEDYQDELNNMGRKGVYVWYGTEDGVEDAFDNIK